MLEKLTCSIEEFAKEFKTRPENISLLINEGYIKAMYFSKIPRITAAEVERFMNEHSGTDFRKVIAEAKKRKQLKELNNNVVKMKKAK